MQKILVTGAAGFIGYHLCKRLLKEGYRILGIDNLNNYYDKNLKIARLDQLLHKDFDFINLDIEDPDEITKTFLDYKPDICINLAAQAGVQYSLKNPKAYIKTNINGFVNILEACRESKVKRVIYASSSSVYGGNQKMPFVESDNVSLPLSLYAATKRTNELLAYVYSSTFGLNTTGLRFFTVYGPWGRPDMSIFKFTKAIINNEILEVYGDGTAKRDFTHVNDIVESIFRLMKKNEEESYRIYNIGNENPISINEVIGIIESKLEKKGNVIYGPTKVGDVPMTYSECNQLYESIGFRPEITVEEGIGSFIDWYINYHSSVSDKLLVNAT